MLTQKIAHLGGGRGIACAKLAKQGIFLGMVTQLRIAQKIVRYVLDHLGVYRAAALDPINLLFQQSEQPGQIAVLQAQQQQNVFFHLRFPFPPADNSPDTERIG